MKQQLLLLSVSFLLIPFLLTAQQDKATDNWAQWRGPLATGAALKGNPPIQFSETQNLAWKTEIPGKGHATPIVWENKIIVLTAVPTDQKVEGGNDENTETGNSWMQATKTDLVLD